MTREAVPTPVGEEPTVEIRVLERPRRAVLRASFRDGLLLLWSGVVELARALWQAATR